MDTHADVHVAAALDQNGGLLGIESFPVERGRLSASCRIGSPGSVR